ncbi:MAG: hypothetical protein KGL39_05245 [Patescibacteria group bacterium]|nr:hypothetical protein [Patescibacteria group bacterium]
MAENDNDVAPHLSPDEIRRVQMILKVWTPDKIERADQLDHYLAGFEAMGRLATFFRNAALLVLSFGAIWYAFKSWLAGKGVPFIGGP